MSGSTENSSTANNGEQKSALCIIVETKGSSPRKTGAKMIVYEDGSIKGTIGGGALEKNVIHNAKKVIVSGIPELFRHDLLHQHAMCCGGTVFIYIEPIVKKKKLFIFGAGHTGKALAEFSEKTDFEIFVIDGRKEMLDQINGENISKMNIEPMKALPALKFNADSFICVMTHDHELDREILAYCLRQPHSYLGMIGSKRKVEVTKKLFSESAFATEEELNSIDMPMGFNIGAEGPDEIAISILSKLIAVKNKIAK
ncbi:XdhC/CoxI family protein [soil metagenome]